MAAQKLGRPQGESQVRAALIDAARSTFLHNSYERVSIRELARRANVDAAMIRYYFGSKAGLFDTMVRETLAPVMNMLRQTLTRESQPPQQLMQAYYQMMQAHPALPRFIYQVLNNPGGNEAYAVLSEVFMEILADATAWVQQLAELEQLKTGLDPKMVRLSFMSLMVFPLIAPRLLLQQFDLEANGNGMQTLLQHNVKVMQHGLFVAPLAELQEPHHAAK
ncbi:TetR/AcrR family transcriptional regulator [Shewanella sp. C32]|uniref:TetR/AcrR family transcriptional regulator n=1 Tax=Shewanella electrica TaxID=515560 RepID=A0ABT2FH46_9GAMM|nr:TetR/AcrR family transcriptional regulator [Shewanella electrica]MCH1923552.1 TetR/AcrR family transcriptional regulator [Shewanella electrica]MCS4555648.1 TetR/AcrR family transcriptional regulator [Shewanella electrica]